MKAILKWFQKYQFSLIGLCVCMLFGSFYVVEMIFSYSESFTIFSPVGSLAQWIASFFTKAPSLLRAGSDRAALTWQLVLVARIILPCIVTACFLALMHMKRPSELSVNSLVVMQIIASSLEVSPLLYFLPLEFPLLFKLRKAWKFLLLQCIAVLCTYVYVILSNPSISIVSAQKSLIGYGELLIFFVLIFVATLAFVHERKSRLNLAAANANLQATQILLNDTVRSSERIRIARDLHDAIGHHLTALNLHLDLASRQANVSEHKVSDNLLASLQTSRELASGLLSEVRGVVSAERDAQPMQLHEALLSLCAGIPKPQINLCFDTDIQMSSALLAHTVFRCVQEVISNTVKHAEATNLLVDVKRTADGIVLMMQDNGKGCEVLKEGNGLNGMRERVLQLGGNLKLNNELMKGFSIEISLPVVLPSGMSNASAMTGVSS